MIDDVGFTKRMNWTVENPERAAAAAQKNKAKKIIRSCNIMPSSLFSLIICASSTIILHVIKPRELELLFRFDFIRCAERFHHIRRLIRRSIENRFLIYFDHVSLASIAKRSFVRCLHFTQKVDHLIALVHTDTHVTR